MTAPYGALKVGRLTLTEGTLVQQKTSARVRTVSLAQQEASAVLGTQAAARDRAEGIQAMDGQTVPVLLPAFPHLNGWYLVSGPDADEEGPDPDTVIRWSTDLVRVGGDSEVEIESRLVGGARVHSTSATPEIWHAPPGGSDSYFVGTSTPGYVDRVSADGTVRVYRSLTAGVNPRWAVPVASYLHGAASITVNGALRTGTTCADTPASWAVSNGLLKVEPRTSTGTLIVTSYLTSGWGAGKVFDVKRGTTSLGAAQHVTVVRNDPCEVVIRLTWDHSPGRTTADLSLKRGSRFVALHVQQYAAASALRVDDNAGGGTVTDQLSAAGYIASTSSDGDGNRWVLGATVASAAAGTFGLAASVAALSMSCFIGCVRGGASPAAGDTAVQVAAQYLGAPAESERVILR